MGDRAADRRAQRADRYLAGTITHPGKMLPAIARAAIAAYTAPGDLVCDPMCGIGTTLVEAVHLNRDAIGVEYETRWADLARANLTHARDHGATGAGRVVAGDPANLAHVGLPGLLDATGKILTGCAALLRPGGIVAMTVRPYRHHGALVDLPDAILHAGEQAGLVPPSATSPCSPGCATTG